MEVSRKNITPNQINILIKNLRKWLVPVSSVYVIILIAIFAIGAITYHFIRQRFTEQRGTQISSIAELKVQQISDFRERGYLNAQLFYGNTSFIRTVGTFVAFRDSASKQELDHWLKPVLKDHFYDEIEIVDAKTLKNVYSVTGNPTARGTTEPGVMKCLETDSILYSDFILSETDNTLQLCIYIPIISRTRDSTEKIAVVKLLINPYNRLYDLIQSMPNSGKTGEVLLVKRDGNDVLYLNELRFRKNTALKFRLPMASNNLPAAKAILGDETVSEGMDYRGKRVLAIARLIPGTSWSVVVKFDIEEIYAQMRTTGMLIIGMVVLLILASGSGLAVLQWRKQIGHYRSRIDDLKTIQRLSRVYELLYNTEQAIVKNSDRETLLYEVCQIVVKKENYVLCWIGFINRNTGYMEPLAHCETQSQYVEIIENAVGEKVHASRNPMLKSIHAGTSFVCNDIWNDPVMEGWQEHALSGQFNSLAAFPLFHHQEIIGAFFLYAEKTGHFIEDEIKILDRMCMDLSYALDKIDLEKKERLSRENLLRNEQRLLENEDKLTRQNQELVALNEKYSFTNEELKKLNDRLEKVNKELDNARRKAEESNQLKSTFLANMSHEIRTPMNAIIGFAELLEKNDISSKTRYEYCQIIIERSNDLLQIINDILDISKIDSHTVTLYMENISVNRFLDDLQMIYQNKLERVEKGKIRLICVKPDAKKPLVLSTDVLKLRQIFTNLLDNAIKFTEEGNIRFGYRSHDKDKMMFFVSDTGIGIDPKEHQKIFKIFTQVESNSRNSYGGTGLGLAICRGNAHLLGGDIYVESEPGKGSTFYFTVNNTQSLEEALKEKQTKTADSDHHWNTKVILLVEDDVYSIEYIKHLMSLTGIKLHVARNGKETEDFFDKLAEIDLVLLDIRLPDSSGLDLLKQLKALRKDLPVIAQTAFAMEDDKLKCLKAGFDDYITKPFKREEFMNLIDSYINSSVNHKGI